MLPLRVPGRTKYGVRQTGPGAPTNAVYVLASANAALTAARVLTNSTTVTWNTGTPGQVSASAVAASDVTAGVAEFADQAEMEAASATNRAVSPQRLLYHPGVAKVWTQFNSAAGVAANFFTSSVTDNAAGSWTVNYSNSFSSSSYPGISHGGHVGGVSHCGNDCITTHSATSHSVGCVRVNGTLADPTSPDAMWYVALGDL